MCSIEHIKHYFYENLFTVVTDHWELLTKLKPNRDNKTNQGRLTRWKNRLIPFNFYIQHIDSEIVLFR